MSIDPRAGTLVDLSDVLDVSKLIEAFFGKKPDVAIASQRVVFGTSGHRGCAFETSFNESHIVAIVQAICRYRAARGIDGPLFVGRDTHAVSGPAFYVALEVLAGNGAITMIDTINKFTPTPAVSHAIIEYNRGRANGLADGIIITPSHNPPEDGGIKYNPPHGGPAEIGITSWIEAAANKLLEANLRDVRRIGKNAAEIRVLPRDWDGQIRMDCSSKYPMQRLLNIKDRFDVAFANDTDADRHGIVTPNGLMEPNSYLATCAHYLGNVREHFEGRKIGKTIVSSAMIDRVAKALGTTIVEVPVGFKWFVDGLCDGSVYFAGEESAGSSFLRTDGSRWSTDKDGLIAGLLAAEITARTGKSPSDYFAGLTEQLGQTFYARIDKPADKQMRAKLSNIAVDTISNKTLAGEPISRKETNASGNGAAIGGIKLSTEKGWIAARPSGTENIYKIYAESFLSDDHLKALQIEAQKILEHI